MPTERVLTREKSRGFSLVLWGALAFAAVIQTVVALRSPAINSDGMSFIRMARELRESPFRAVRENDQHPGYPFLVLVGRGCFGQLAAGDGVEGWVAGARVFPWIAGVLSVGVVWVWVRRAFDARIADSAAVVCAVLPLFRDNAADAMSDMPCLLLYVTGAWLLTEGMIRRRAGWFAGAGLASGLAYWIRPEGLSVAVVGGAMLCLMIVRGRTRRFAGGALAALLVTACATAAPYVMIKGRVTSKKDMRQLVEDSGGRPAEAARSRIVREASVARAGLTMPRRLARGIWVLLLNFAEDGLRVVFLLPLALGVFWPGARRAGPEARRVMAALAMFHVLLLILLYMVAGYINGRHVMVLSVLSMGWIGSGMSVVGGLLHKGLSFVRPGPSWLGPERLTWVVLAAVVLVFLPRSIRPLHRKRIPLVAAGRWAREQTRPGERILTMTIKEHALFYSEREGRNLASPDAAVPELGVAPGEALPYALVIAEGECYGPECRWWAAVRKHYAERIVGGVSGGARRIHILAPKE